MKQETALKLLKAGENVFLTGSAGAGKTYTLNQYINYLKARKVPVAITASTDIAATHMNGMTIHTWAGIGIKDHLSDDDLKRMKERKYLKEHLENAQVLIIDEISMLHAKQLNLVKSFLGCTLHSLISSSPLPCFSLISNTAVISSFANILPWRTSIITSPFL